MARVPMATSRPACVRPSCRTRCPQQPKGLQAQAASGADALAEALALAEAPQ
jgi:hypothetical protein